VPASPTTHYNEEADPKIGNTRGVERYHPRLLCSGIVDGLVRFVFSSSVNIPQEVKLKRPAKEPDRVYPVAKNQEYDRVYDWEDRAR
jgi:hypothetical protein